MTKIGENAFGDTRWYNAQPDGVLYLDGWIVGIKGDLSGGLTIKDGTKGIAARAFANCYGLSSVKIPDGMLYIGDAVFQGCNNPSVNIPNSVKVIGNWAFYGAEVISPSVPENVTYIGGGAFWGIYNMSNIILPNSVTYIGEMAFSHCKKVISLIDNPHEISSNAFSEQILNNATLYVPSGSIDKYKSTKGWNQFANIEEGWPTQFSKMNADGKEINYNCLSETELEVTSHYGYSGSVVIPETVTCMNRTWKVTRIGDYAFAGCSELASVNIPNSVTSIGEGAFANIIPPTNAPRRADGAVLTISCYALNVPQTATNAFENTPIDKAMLLVYDEVVNDYSNVEPWKNFGTVQGFNGSSGIDVIWASENSNAKVYTLDGKQLDKPHEGINIVRMNDGTTKKVVVK